MAEDYNSIGFKNADIDKLKSIMSNFDKSGDKVSSEEEPKKDPVKNNVTKTEVKNPDGSITYKTKWNNEAPSSNAKPEKKSTAKVVSTKKPTSNNTSSRVYSSKGEREITTIIPMKTAGVVQTKLENKLPKIMVKGDERTWQQKRKDEVIKTDYDKYKQQGETMSEWKDRASKSSKEVAKKNRDKSRDLSGGSGKGPSGSGGCKNCR